ncbi:enoyl-CoA hydratase/isomerase family protein [Piscinibacter koreensis]|uniref:Enoyl-CoA hydratase/isomerase family protein n=1 Tax=Piscinibacter koreensis TaxID=2742824 RepID=A0A7Y6TVF5_9BURK|nr:enoyl-CoA hydratase/isomerase family protein [Schlegelella koreensis]NUZ05059.1 enoyl-CoA hydratase/isomerase family protein [Schlegelella koreensis]
MIEFIPREQRLPRLAGAGLPQDTIETFVRAIDASRERLEEGTLREAIQQGRALLGAMPLRSQRNAAQKLAGQTAVQLMADATWRFFRRQAVPLYRELTDGGRRSLRVEALLWEAAARWPDILPTEGQLAEECERMQADKDGLEIHQGLFVSMVLSDPACGHHLIRSMLRPRAESLALLDEFVRTGRADLGKVKIVVEGETAHVTLHNERYLNSEDDTTVGPLEIATDLVLMNPNVRMGLLRGSVVDHPKYKGRRVFCSGINLTRIYQGKQSYLSFLYRNMAMHNKLYRGVLLGDEPDSLDVSLTAPEQTVEKLWVAVVESFAIGGGCQLLLVVDHVIAEKGSYFSLPARKEGFLPGTSNMRLPRFVGERAAREAIMFDRVFHADSPEGRMIANQVVARDEIDAALATCIENAVGSGMVSAGANRKAMRQQTETLEAFRGYLATYAYEQGFCHLSEQLIRNLERHWNASQRKL